MQLSNPQSLNRYSYAQNDPLDLVDPLGLLNCPPGQHPHRTIAGGGEHCVHDDDNAGGSRPTSIGPISAECLLESLWAFEGNWSQEAAMLTCESDYKTRLYSLINAAAENRARLNKPANNFTLGVRAPGQTFSQCLSSNAGNYSIAGVFNIQNEAGKFLLGNDAANILFADRAEGAAGLALAEGGSRGFEAGVGTAGTFGRRTASIFSLNLAGKTGPAPMILGKTGAAKIVGVVSGAAELKLAVDIGLTGAEAIGCAFYR
jgi:hypothetical protein